MQLKKLPNVILRRIPSIANPSEQLEENKGASWTGSGYSKLAIWTLTEYDIVFYIDADCLVVDPSVLDGFKFMMKNERWKLAAAPATNGAWCAVHGPPPSRSCAHSLEL